MNIVVGIHTGAVAVVIVVVCASTVDCAVAGTVTIASGIAVGINQAGAIASAVGIH